MSLLSFLHSYEAGDVIDSSDWNDELNQILYALGYGITNTETFNFIISGATDESTNPIVKLNNSSTGDLLQISNGTIQSIIKNNGQLVLGANGIVGLVVASVIKCINLNADKLNGKDSTELETRLYSYGTFQVLFYDLDLLGAVDKGAYIAKGGEVITKLKGCQEGVASANAVTVITVNKNGSSIGTITINGNSTAVVSNDIADVPLVENDVITFTTTTYTGTTKHNWVTASVHFKNKYTN